MFHKIKSTSARCPRHSRTVQSLPAAAAQSESSPDAPAGSPLQSLSADATTAPTIELEQFVLMAIVVS
jgi:hypothetical protein